MKSVAPETVGLSSEKLGLVNEAMQTYIDQSRFPGIVTMVARRGEIAHAECFGYMDLESQKQMRIDAIFRLASMTKPITTVAMMILIERGLVQLSNPITKFIPEFKDKKVYAGMKNGEMQFVEAEREITIQDLLTYVSGLLSPYTDEPALQELNKKINMTYEEPWDEMIQKILEPPLEDQPGKRWRYGFDQIIITKVIEVLSGKSFGNFLADEIFKPLDMTDTGFYFSEEKLDQITTAYDHTDPANPQIHDAPKDFLTPPKNENGAGNLLSSTPDYMRFAQMLMNNGEFDGKRILSPETIALMTTNQLSKELLPFGIPAANAIMSGYGFGLGVGIMMDTGQTQIPGSVGEYGWPGMYTTYFWNDPSKELTGIFMAQVTPPQFWPNLVPPEFKKLVYQAITD